MKKELAIFDLDGVLVDTAVFHYQAWKHIAKELQVTFNETYNEKLKGVSRKESLDIILSIDNRKISDREKEELLKKKNELYLEYIEELKDSDILPGALELIHQLKEKNIKICLGSASKNAQMILEKTNLIRYFDFIVDGNNVHKAKPNPEVFEKGARALEIPSDKCVVFEDSEAGCQAAKKAGMYTVGLGNSAILKHADIVINSLEDEKIITLFI